MIVCHCRFETPHYYLHYVIRFYPNRRHEAKDHVEEGQPSILVGHQQPASQPARPATAPGEHPDLAEDAIEDAAAETAAASKQ